MAERVGAVGAVSGGRDGTPIAMQGRSANGPLPETPAEDPARFWRQSKGGARLMRYLSLVYTGFFVIQPIYEHSWEMWLWFGIVYVAFLGLYFGIPHTEGRLQRSLLAQFFALGYIYFPFNQSASGIFVYPIVILAFMPSSVRTYVTILVAQACGIALETWLFHLHWWAAGMGILFSVVVGVGNLAYTRDQRAAFQLRVANDEIEHLAQVSERERIARDLHDLLGHTLTLITIKSELANRLFDADPARARQEMAEVEQTARKALAEVREAVSGYRGDGLSAEIGQARRALTAAGVQLAVNAEPLTLPTAQAAVLCLALREGVTNVVRHAQASSAVLTLQRNGEEVRMQLEDNGTGVHGCEGNGLCGMRERLRKQGGSATLEQAVGGGAVLTVSLRIAGRASASTVPVSELGDANGNAPDGAQRDAFA